MTNAWSALTVVAAQNIAGWGAARDACVIDGAGRHRMVCDPDAAVPLLGSHIASTEIADRVARGEFVALPPSPAKASHRLWVVSDRFLRVVAEAGGVVGDLRRIAASDRAYWYGHRIAVGVWIRATSRTLREVAWQRLQTRGDAAGVLADVEPVLHAALSVAARGGADRRAVVAMLGVVRLARGMTLDGWAETYAYAASFARAEGYRREVARYQRRLGKRGS